MWRKPMTSLSKMKFFRGTWLAQSVEDAALDLEVVGSSPTLGVEITLKKKAAMICLTKKYLWEKLHLGTSYHAVSHE